MPKIVGDIPFKPGHYPVTITRCDVLCASCAGDLLASSPCIPATVHSSAGNQSSFGSSFEFWKILLSDNVKSHFPVAQKKWKQKSSLKIHGLWWPYRVTCFGLGSKDALRGLSELFSGVLILLAGTLDTKQNPLAVTSENTRLQIYGFQKFLLRKPAITFFSCCYLIFCLRTFFYFDLGLNYICTLCAICWNIQNIRHVQNI